MRVLSLFDWIACWYEALIRAWIKVDAYYASEIDKYAIQIAQKNHPDIIQLGDVKNIEGGGRLSNIELLIWWSPCQWFSIAWKMLNFDDPRSKLFFEFVRILREVKPKYFLLENVKMKKEWQDIISQQLWVEPIEINSSLVSAQSRRRLYRTNIPNVTQPQDKGILLKDILQENVDEKYNFSKERWERIMNTNYDQGKRLENIDGKCNTLVTNGWGNHEKKIMVSYAPWSREFFSNWWNEEKCPTLLARDYKDPKVVMIPKEWEELISVVDDEIRVKQATKQWYIVAEEWDGISLSFPHSTTRRWRVVKWKANTLVTQGDSYVCEPKMAYNPHTRDFFVNWWKEWKSFTISAMDYAHPKVVNVGTIIRKLTPIECERLQTLPDNYTEWVSDTQRYKMLGNGRTVDVIAHIFSFICRE